MSEQLPVPAGEPAAPNIAQEFAANSAFADPYDAVKATSLIKARVEIPDKNDPGKPPRIRYML